jgi:very-short-patch-repair endonuclease
MGVVSYEQLRDLGYGDERIRKWVQRQRLLPLFHTVYGFGHAKLCREGWFIAAVLAAGEGSVLSHRTAAFHWGLLDERGSLIDVTTPRRSQDGLAGIRLHRPRVLSALDVTSYRDIPVTTVARTLIDLAHGEPDWVVRRAWDQAEMARRLDPLEVAEAIERAGPRRGIRKVKRLLFLTRPRGIERTKSGLEIKFLRLADSTDLPTPEVNEKICGWEADFFWRDQRLIVETDGGEYHRTALRRLRDAERDRVHRRAGYAVIRIADIELNDRPAEVVNTVREALSAHRGTASGT